MHATSTAAKALKEREAEEAIERHRAEMIYEDSFLDPFWDGRPAGEREQARERLATHPIDNLAPKVTTYTVTS